MTRWKRIGSCLVAGVLALQAGAALAAPVFDEFGSLPEATWGGTGIPNDRVAITTIEDGNYTITLGMSAHERFQGPLADDGAGTYFAPEGPDPNDSTRGAWNFNYFIAVEPGAGWSGNSIPSAFDFTLDFGLQPGVADGQAQLTGCFFFGGKCSNPRQGSSNLAFGVWTGGTDLIWNITESASGSYDPFAEGLYSFTLTALRDGDALGQSGINVQVGTASVPEPTTVLLALFGLLMLAGSRWRLRGRSEQLAA